MNLNVAATQMEKLTAHPEDEIKTLPTSAIEKSPPAVITNLLKADEGEKLKEQ